MVSEKFGTRISSKGSDPGTGVDHGIYDTRPDHLNTNKVYGLSLVFLWACNLSQFDDSLRHNAGLGTEVRSESRNWYLIGLKGRVNGSSIR